MRRSIGCVALFAALTLAPSLAAAQDDNPFAACKPGDPRSFLGNRVELIPERPGALRHYLTGNVTIVCNDMTLFADEIVYETDTKLVHANGNVTFQQPDLSIFAERAVIHGDTKLGTFYQATGTARLAAAPLPRSALGSTESDVMFHAEEIARTAPTTYRMKGGAFTTCVQPTPRWQMVGSSATIVLDKRVLMTHVQLRVKDVPLLYLPFIYYPIEKDDRSSGFLMPSYGTTTIGGANLSNAFFWAINRSQDATLSHMWNAESADIYRAEYRYVASDSSRGDVSFRMVGEDTLEGSTVGLREPRSYAVQGGINQELTRRFRLNGRANYFTSAARQQHYQDPRDASRSTSEWNVTLTGNLRRLELTAGASQYDVFTASTKTNQSGQRPNIRLALPDSPIGRTRIYYGASGSAVYLIDNNLTVGDRSLFRMDALPRIRASLSSLPFLSASGDASWRLTHWTESIDTATNQQVPVALTRQLVTVGANATGPTLTRVFQTPNNGYALRFQHLIEPRFSINRTFPFDDFRRVVVLDSLVDSITPDTTSVTYRLSNRLRARQRAAGDLPGVIRDLLVFDISQTYYSNPLAAVNDPNNRSGNTPTNFSPLRLRFDSAPSDLFLGGFQFEVDPERRAVREYSANGRLTKPNLQVDGTWVKRQVVPGLRGFEEANKRQSLTATTNFRSSQNRMGGSYAMTYDLSHAAFGAQRITGYFNSQCCGLAFDWQRAATPLTPGTPVNTVFQLTFTLAGLGSFANPLGAFGGMR